MQLMHAQYLVFHPKEQDWGILTEMKTHSTPLIMSVIDRYVFNIKGNRYRLIVMIFFDLISFTIYDSHFLKHIWPGI